MSAIRYVAALLLAALLQLPAAKGFAQGTRSCERADSVVRAPQPGRALGRSAWVLRGCPGGAGALAQAFRAHRADRDPAALEWITRPMRGLPDAVVTETAMGIAGSRAASPQARVFAVRALIWRVSPSLAIDYPGLAAPASPGSCAFGIDSEQDGPPARAATAGERSRIREMLNQLRNDPSPEVRNAATCGLVLTSPPRS